MRARARSAKPPSSGSGLGTQLAMPVLRRGRAQPRPPRPDRPQPLAQPGPRPRLDLAVADRRLASRRLEILEPGVRLFDHQQLFRLSLRRHVITPGVAHDCANLRSAAGRTPPEPNPRSWGAGRVARP